MTREEELTVSVKALPSQELLNSMFSYDAETGKLFRKYLTGSKRSLGYHKEEIEAARAYDRAARELHGQFATLNFPEEA